MPFESTPLWTGIALACGALLYVVGGIRFRRWAIDDRWGVPRFSRATETVLLWLVYSGAVSVGIIILRQTLREL